MFSDRGGFGGSNNGDGGGVNPGNNLHVSGISNRIDERELESIFSKYGKVRTGILYHDPLRNLLNFIFHTTRSTRRKSCLTRTVASRVALVS